MCAVAYASLRSLDASMVCGISIEVCACVRRCDECVVQPMYTEYEWIFTEWYTELNPRQRVSLMRRVGTGGRV